MISFWFLTSCIYFFLELGNPGLFYFLALSIGAFVSGWIEYFEYTLELQISMFVTVTIASLFFLYRFVRHTQTKPVFHSNIYALKGLKVFVESNIIPPHAGTVKTQGTIWNAES